MYKEPQNTIFSLQNPMVLHSVKLRNLSDYRNKKNAALIIGTDPILEISKTIHPKIVWSSDLKLLTSVKKAKSYILTNNEIMKKISGLVTPPELIAEFDIPKKNNLKNVKSILVLDGVSDPGNVGNLIRTAAGLHWNAIWFLPNCVDPFNDKVIRASRGGLWKIAFNTGSHEELMNFIKKHEFCAYLADVNGATNLSNLSTNLKSALILGSEGNGISKCLKQIGIPIKIPMASNTESLNVASAGAILMYELKKSL